MRANLAARFFQTVWFFYPILKHASIVSIHIVLMSGKCFGKRTKRPIILVLQEMYMSINNLHSSSIIYSISYSVFVSIFLLWNWSFHIFLTWYQVLCFTSLMQLNYFKLKHIYCTKVFIKKKQRSKTEGKNKNVLFISKSLFLNL